MRSGQRCKLDKEMAVHPLASSRTALLVYLHDKMADVTEEEYRLCARQFESMPNMIQILAAAGKMPSWVMGDEV